MATTEPGPDLAQAALELLAVWDDALKWNRQGINTAAWKQLRAALAALPTQEQALVAVYGVSHASHVKDTETLNVACRDCLALIPRKESP